MSPWEILGVERNSSPEDIKLAYRKLARIHHPDKNGGSDESLKKFQQIQEAYDAIKDGGQHNQNQNFDDFAHHFSNFGFGGFGFRPKNADYQVHASITLEQAYKGTTLSISVGEKVITVNVPAGSDSGYNFRIENEGSRDNPQLPPGHLLVMVIVDKHGVFQREQEHLHVMMEIDAIDLMLGCTKNVTTLTGEELAMTIPECSGVTKMRLAGKGMPVMHSNQFGDLYVHLRPVFPKTLTAKQKKALRSAKKP